MVPGEINYDVGTVVDLENDTVTPDVLLVGETAHDATGASITGTMRTVPDSFLLNGKDPTYYIQPTNILDNSYFDPKYIVNQNGFTTYSGAIQRTIDRWKTSNTNTTVSITDDGIRLTNTTSNSGGYIVQFLSNSSAYLGKTFTLAVMESDGTIRAASGTLPTEFPSSTLQRASISVSGGYTIGAILIDSTKVYVRIYSATNETTRCFKWVALYEGTYTADTLPPYVYKGYQAELQACLRYYKITNINVVWSSFGVGVARTSTEAWIQYPRTPMVSSDVNVTFSGNPIVYCGSGSGIPATSVSVVKVNEAEVKLSVKVASGLTVGYGVILSTGDTANADICIIEDTNM